MTTPEKGKPSAGAMRAAHTPGPWTVGRGRSTNAPDGLITVLGPIGIDHDHWTGWYFDVSDEDARLIAAAPDMLAALQECREQLLHEADDFCKTGKCARCIVAEQVEAAIAKALGDGRKG